MLNRIQKKTRLSSCSVDLGFIFRNFLLEKLFLLSSLQAYFWLGWALLFRSSCRAAMLHWNTALGRFTNSVSDIQDFLQYQHSHFLSFPLSASLQDSDSLTSVCVSCRVQESACCHLYMQSEKSGTWPSLGCLLDRGIIQHQQNKNIIIRINMVRPFLLYLTFFTLWKFIWIRMQIWRSYSYYLFTTSMK